MLKKYILYTLLITVLFTACDDRQNDPVVRPLAAPTITSPPDGSSFLLVESTPDAVIGESAWTAADFGYDAAITYRIQIDVAGNDFSDFTQIGATTELSDNQYTMGQLNNVLLAKGLPFGFDNPLEFRICADVGSGVAQLCSDPISITVNPFQAEVIFPFLTVPGSYQDWNPADENFKVFSRKSDDIYEGFIYFGIDDAVYKFAQNLSWDVNWGDVEPDGILDPQGIDNNIAINDGAGLYRLSCDLNSLTHANEKTVWGVLGSATPTGNDADTDLEWDGEKLTTTIELTAGDLRFRANDSEDINFGDEFTNGTLDYNGPVIPVEEAGSYTINLWLVQSDYLYELIKN